MRLYGASKNKFGEDDITSKSRISKLRILQIKFLYKQLSETPYALKVFLQYVDVNSHYFK